MNNIKKFQMIERVPLDYVVPQGLSIPIAIGVLSASSANIIQYDLSKSAMAPLRNYPYANQLVITNTSAQIIKVRLGFSEDSAYYVPGNTIYPIKNVRYTAFDLQNTGTADTTATQVIANVIYEPADRVQIVSR